MNGNTITLGSSNWNAAYGSTVSGTAKGTDTTVGRYYTGYYYSSASSATVTTSGAIVYRYFTPQKYQVTCIDRDAETLVEFARNTKEYYYGTTANGGDWGNNTAVDYYYESHYLSSTTSTVVQTSGNTVYRNFTSATYTVTCIDKVHDVNGQTLGTQSWQTKQYYIDVPGGRFGDNSNPNKYYSGYYLTSYTTERLTPGTYNVTVYRFFEPITILEMPETGDNSKILIYSLGMGIIAYSIFLRR